MSDLRERVARAIYEAKRARLLEAFGDTAGWPEWEKLRPTLREIQMEECDPYIALVRAEVLEEAARVAEGKSVEAAGNVYQTDKPGNFWDEDSVYGTGRRQAADAIRALKSKP